MRWRKGEQIPVMFRRQLEGTWRWSHSVGRLVTNRVLWELMRLLGEEGVEEAAVLKRGGVMGRHEVAPVRNCAAQKPGQG